MEYKDRMSNALKPLVTAAMLIIGDEILSGRTQDANIRALANFLAPHGVQLHEARVVGDRSEDIIAAVNALRARFSYVFTSGGIGPTHDDITAKAIADAFGVPIGVREDARAILEAHYGEALNEARLRMARIPEGAVLIANPVSKAPGFQLGNVFVLAGVPSILRGMLEDVAHRMESADIVLARSLRAPGLREGDIGTQLGQLQRTHALVSIGSYPWFDASGYGVNLVLRSTDATALEAALAETAGLVRGQGIEALVQPGTSAKA